MDKIAEEIKQSARVKHGDIVGDQWRNFFIGFLGLNHQTFDVRCERGNWKKLELDALVSNGYLVLNVQEYLEQKKSKVLQ